MISWWTTDGHEYAKSSSVQTRASQTDGYQPASLHTVGRTKWQGKNHYVCTQLHHTDANEAAVMSSWKSPSICQNPLPPSDDIAYQGRRDEQCLCLAKMFSHLFTHERAHLHCLMHVRNSKVYTIDVHMLPTAPGLYS